MTAVDIAGMAAAAREPRPSRSRLVRVLRWALGLGAVAVEVALIVPGLATHAARGTLHWWWLATAVAAEAVSVLAVGALYRPLLAAGGVRATRRRSFAVGATASAITATVPGGSVATSAFLYRQFRRTGSPPALASWAVAATTALSVIAFATVTSTTAALGGAHTVDATLTRSGIAASAFAAIIGASTLLTRHARPVIRVVAAAWERLAHRHADTADSDTWTHRALAQLSTIRPQLRHWLTAASLAVMTWVGDLACFVLSLHAVGIDGIDLRAAALAYGAGLATTSVNLLPAGIGTVETGMALGLAHAGIDPSRAMIGILTYRGLAYALVGVTGWAVWAAFRSRSVPTENSRSLDR